MAILIAGGSGFVGLNVAEQLLERGEEVIIFGPDAPPAIANKRFGQLPGKFHFVKGDVCSASDLDAAISKYQVSKLINAAAITADVAREKHSARRIIGVNLIGTIELLEAALRHKLARVVQVGTGSIFGAAGTASQELDEQKSPVLPESLYGISKFAAERVALRYRATRQLDVTVVRLGMVFGRWEYDTGVRDTLSMSHQTFLAARRGESIVVHTEAADDWVYSVDVARGLIAVLDTPTLPEPIYHLSAGRHWPIGDWCERLKKQFPAFSYRLSDQLAECTLGQNKPKRRSIMNIDRMRRDTGYAPAYLPEKAFADYLAWSGEIGNPA